MPDLELVHEAAIPTLTHLGPSTITVQVLTGPLDCDADVCPWCLEGPGWCAHAETRKGPG